MDQPSLAVNPVDNLPPRSFAAVTRGPPRVELQSDPQRATKKHFDDSHHSSILGTYSQFKGKPGIRFSDAETALLVQPLKFSLVGKFSHGIPSFKALTFRFTKLGLKGNFKIGVINPKHVLITLSNEEDYSRIWLRGVWIFDGFPMRVFKWSPDFNPSSECSIAPVWIRFPELPCHLFNKQALFSIANIIGTPLLIDESTADLSRPSLARVCVELDLLKDRPDEIFLGIGDKTIVQKIIFENCPEFCSFCCHLGHSAASCFLRDPSKKPADPESAANIQQKQQVDLRQIIDRKRGKTSAIPQLHPKINVVNGNDDKVEKAADPGIEKESSVAAKYPQLASASSPMKKVEQNRFQGVDSVHISADKTGQEDTASSRRKLVSNSDSDDCVQFKSNSSRKKFNVVLSDELNSSNFSQHSSSFSSPQHSPSSQVEKSPEFGAAHSEERKKTDSAIVKNSEQAEPHEADLNHDSEQQEDFEDADFICKHKRAQSLDTTDQILLNESIIQLFQLPSDQEDSFNSQTSKKYSDDKKATEEAEHTETESSNKDHSAGNQAHDLQLIVSQHEAQVSPSTMSNPRPVTIPSKSNIKNGRNKTATPQLLKRVTRASAQSLHSKS